MKDFLLNNGQLLTKTVEILAALFGTYYLKKTNNKILSIFVYFLWITVVVEILGMYPYLLQHNYDYPWFISLKNGVFCSNLWLYNMFSFFTIGLLGVFYSDLLTNKIFKIIIRAIVLVYSIFSIVFYTMTDAFFEKTLPYDSLLASLFVSLFVVFYFIELIRSEYILIYYKLPSFYISVALLLWYLCTTPLFIFDSYFYAMNTKFVEFRSLFLLIINIFTYSCIIFGFWYPLYKKKQ